MPTGSASESDEHHEDDRPEEALADPGALGPRGQRARQEALEAALLEDGQGPQEDVGDQPDEDAERDEQRQEQSDLEERAAPVHAAAHERLLHGLGRALGRREGLAGRRHQ